MTKKQSVADKQEIVKLQSGAFAVVFTAIVATRFCGVIPVVLFVTATVMFGAICYLLAD